MGHEGVPVTRVGARRGGQGVVSPVPQSSSCLLVLSIRLYEAPLTLFSDLRLKFEFPIIVSAPTLCQEEIYQSVF
mgnify:CR=1 FL=1